MGRWDIALEWFSRIVSLDSDHVEAISNFAATLYCLNRHSEAETHWRQAVRKKPTYLEAVEHLVGLLCSSHRSKEAVEIIEFVQRSIRFGESTIIAARDGDDDGISSHSVDAGSELYKTAINPDELAESARQPGFGSSGYCVPGSENGRVIALIHAKGNMLYALKDIDRATKSFEEAVLISAGGGLRGIQSLIRRVQSVLAPAVVQGALRRDNLQSQTMGPLLLPPDRAKHTAQMVFAAAHGELPGLRHVPDGVPKKSAISTTSNSLLSLAKIFQDAMSNGGAFPSLLRQPSGIGDILALYYLSLSLSESPSTANNVGILLASVQQSGSTPQAQILETSSAPPIPGIVPGSGLHLALMYYNYGLQLDSKHVHLHTNLGSLLKDIGQLDLAIQMYERAVECDGTFDIALTNLANAVKDRGRISDAIMYYKKAVSSNPQFAEAVCGLSTALNSVCDWRGRGGVLLLGGKYDRYHVNEQGLPEDVHDTREGSGLVKKVVDIVSKQLLEASHWGTGVLPVDSLETYGQKFRALLEDEADKSLDLSQELRKWMQSVFGFHDPSRAKAFCYATTASDRSIHRQQIEREAPVFRDVSNWSAERLVNQIIKDEIHILVNLNGYTRGARNEIFAARPAPIQMSFMGFAGTLGAEWCDYILADETAIPPQTLRPMRSNLGLEGVFQDEELNEEEDWMYSENVIFCRDSFFCCDHAQSCEPEERAVTWEEEQRRRWKMRREIFPNLSEDTIILGNFNQLYKIDPTTFRTWLRILTNCPKAILWLLKFPELGENNLRRTARDWAGDEVASRIIFTDVAPKQQHISRARVCDLFLDTPECNAHTTAADVLWSSTPLLTLPRYPYKMCSRMAASILKGALPRNADGRRAAGDLIAADDADYEAMATRLVSSLTYRRSNAGYCEGRGRLAEIRRTLFDAKWTCGLFDTRRWVSDLECAYDEAWRRWVAGESGDIYL
ncbi:putative glycosyltransferase family 41 protein [Eutypa lata UCREL1]|uniref:protein O-GlcNAc transferase n=1 Tax=Eutypa lata (strain UCR-EL1) TaxID=1287681 RepID=M7SDG8_EUTLA|nr:putative glycosyltransferase family 41 protein [Eutypa lata UCREL1]